MPDGNPTEDTASASLSSGSEDGWIARVLDRTDVAVFVVDNAAQQVERANDACARMMGAGSAGDLIGKSILALYPDPNERAEIQARLLANPKFRQTGRARLQVRRIRQDTREVVDLAISLAATFDSHGAVSRMECVMDELGGTRVDERAFRLSEERFRVLFDTNQIGMVLTDLDGHVTRANPAFCAFTGRSAEELVGRDLYALLDAENRPERPIPDDRGGFELGERRVVRPNGDIRWGSFTGSWLSDGDALPHSSVVVVQDVTEKRTNEQTLQRIAKLESLGLLAGGIAHDFNNVLATVQVSLAELNRRAELEPNARELLQNAVRAAERAASLARELLTFANGGTPQRRVRHLSPLLRETAHLCERGSRLRIDVEVTEDLLRCHIDAGQINQVLNNLFVNAIQSMPDGGRVMVRAENMTVDAFAGLPLPSGRYVCVSVLDEGVGILREHMDRIFDPYFTTKSTGSGLGLAIAHSIVARHGGLLTAESALDRGSVFRVYLPATDEQMEPEIGVPSAISLPRPNTRVLVMDDEETLRKVTLRMLASYGIEAEGARDGAEVVAIYRAALEKERPFDAVILDLTIRGGMGGDLALLELRKVNPNVRAIVMSGYSNSRVMSEWEAHGFSGAVAKPFRPETLIAAVVAATEAER